MASFFQSLSDDMEKVAQVVEEGAKILMGTATRMGESGGRGGVSGIINDDNVVGHDEDGDGGQSFSMNEDDEEYGSPLMGMADSVLSDIMSSQVRIDALYYQAVSLHPRTSFKI